MVNYKLIEPYVRHLLEDISAGRQPEDYWAGTKPDFPRFDDDEREKYFAELDRFFGDNSDCPPLSWHCGLEPEVFPPAERLSDKQVKRIVRVLRETMFSWGVGTDIPEGVSNRTIYTLLIPLLRERFTLDQYGTSTWTFCASDINSCLFGDHCRCKDYEWMQDIPDEAFAEEAVKGKGG